MTQKKSTALERARADLQAGRPDKARDRLNGYLRTLNLRAAYSEEAYLLLGETYFAMKDFQRAGAAWLLTERDDKDTVMAAAAFHERYGKDPKNIRRALKPRALLEAYPPKVRERLSAWGYQYARYDPRNARTLDGAAEPGSAHASGVRPIEAGCLLFAIMSILFIAYYFYLVFSKHR